MPWLFRLHTSPFSRRLTWRKSATFNKGAHGSLRQHTPRGRSRGTPLVDDSKVCGLISKGAAIWRRVLELLRTRIQPHALRNAIYPPLHSISRRRCGSPRVVTLKMRRALDNRRGAARSERNEGRGASPKLPDTKGELIPLRRSAAGRGGRREEHLLRLASLARPAKVPVMGAANSHKPSALQQDQGRAGRRARRLLQSCMIASAKGFENPT